MKIDLSGTTALVTGSTAGIGFATAVGLARAGAHVIVNGRQDKGVTAAVERLKREVAQASVQGVAADVSGAQGCEALLRAVPRVDILVNNTGIFDQVPFFDIPDADWEKFFQTNVMSGVRLSRAYLKGMMERQWGRVVFISSESAINIPEAMIHYGLTKTAQLSLSRGLAKLARGTGVTVNSVLPGPTLTEGVAEMLKPQTAATGKSLEQAGSEFVKAHRSSSIIGRMSSPEEVANMVVYVCSRQASSTTGAALRVDGGVAESVL